MANHQGIKKHHPLSIYDQYNQAMRLLSKSAVSKLNMIFTMDYLEPIAAFSVNQM